MSSGVTASGPVRTVQPNEIKIVTSQGAIDDGIVELRRLVYRDETRLLSEADLVSEDDVNGTHCRLFYQGNLIGSSLGVEAEKSSLAKLGGLTPEQLAVHYLGTRVTVAPEFRNSHFGSLLCYALLREGRILGRKKAIGLFDRTDAAVIHILGASPVPSVPPFRFTGHEGHEFELRAMATDTSYGMYRCWAKLPEGMKAYVAENLLSDEVIRTVLRETHRFYGNPWFQQVAAGTLTKRQYVEFLANNYQFVRWTTRILARIAGLTEERDLRNHYLHHLSGEVDHELLIEQDLMYLGADLDYVCNHMSPAVDIGHFMGVQEALVGFRSDPVGLLAVPIAIESLTAHLSSDFLVNLERCVRNWGYSDPSKAISYLRSHIPIDGGDDGHWQRTGQAIRKYLRTEQETQRFVGIVRMVIFALDRALRSYV